MRFLLCILLATTFTAAIAQDDDLPDYRSKRENLLKIPEKDIQADVATFTLAGIDISNGRPAITGLPLTASGDDFVTFDSGGVSTTIRSGIFNPAKHKLLYSDKYLVRIDTKPYFGNYGKMPKKTVQSVTVVVGADTVAIPPAAYADLYEPGLMYSQGGEEKSQDGVYLSANHRYIYVYMLCNDGLGGYEVTWVIADKKYYRRIVDFNVIKN